MRGIVVPLSKERDIETLRQISLLLERENQRLITKNLQLTAEPFGVVSSVFTITASTSSSEMLLGPPTRGSS